MAAVKRLDPIPWEDVPFPDEKIRSWSVGPLVIHVMRGETEWKLAWKRLSSDRPAKKELAPPPDREWARWTAGESGDVLKFTPVLPDLPLVSKLENPLLLLRSAKARIYVSVPVWVRVSLPGQKEIVVTEIAAASLSKSWDGQVTSGRVVYWKRTRARTTHGEEDAGPEIVTCPVTIENRSDQDLVIKKFTLALPYLTVFGAGGRLFSDMTHIVYKGPGEFETVHPGGEAPEEFDDGEKLGPARVTPRSGLAALTFSPLKILSEWTH